MSDAEKCCVCGNKFTGLFKADRPSDSAVQALKQLGKNVDDYCLQCFVKKRAEVENDIEANIEELKTKLKSVTEEELEKIQVFTTPPPEIGNLKLREWFQGILLLGQAHLQK